MKRVPKHIRQLDVIATLLDWLFIGFALFIIASLFRVLEMPTIDDLTAVIETTYVVHGIQITSAEANLIISLLVVYFIIFIPNTIMNTKRVRSKDVIEIDEWTYRTQFLYGTLSLVTLNIFSFVLRYKIALTIRRIYLDYGIDESFRRLIQSIKDLFNGESKKRRVEKKAAKEKLSDSQHDLETINRKDFFLRVISMVSTYAFLTLIAVFIFIPFYWMILTSLKTFEEIQYTMNPRFFIGFREMQWVNFKTAFTRLDVSLYIRNTIYVGVMSTIGTILTTVLAAFAFARLEFKGRDFIFSVLLMTMMIPGELYVITNYITV